MSIRKVVIPAAGLGTRFLPFTKAVPKEMLPLINKPAIQHIIEEGLASGIQHFLIITAQGKEAIAHYFNSAHPVTQFLKERNKSSLLETVEAIIQKAQFTYITQKKPRGLGDAVQKARQAIHNEYFGVMLPDDIIMSQEPSLKQLSAIAERENASVIAVQEVSQSAVSSYGIIAIKKQITDQLFVVKDLVEKPREIDAPSNLAIIGRYILSHKIFASLEHVSSSVNGELQLTNAIAHMLHNNEKVLAYKIPGERYDIGAPNGWIKAVIDLALTDDLYKQEVQDFIAKKFLKK